MKSFFRRLFSTDVVPTTTLTLTEGELNRNLEQGQILERGGELDLAIECYRQAAAAWPGSAAAHRLLGDALAAKGRVDDAIAAYGISRQLDPTDAVASFNAGTLLLPMDVVRAEAAFRQALEIKPEWVDAWVALGCALDMRGVAAEACEVYRRALDLSPGDAGATSRLADHLRTQGKGREAMRLLRIALDKWPSNPILLLARAELRVAECNYDDALDDYQKSMESSPNLSTYDGLLWTLNFIPDVDPATIREQHRQYGAMLADMTTPMPRKEVDRTAKKIRVGYVSPDFRMHPVACFVEPLLRYHNRDEFEIHAFYNGSDWDEITRGLSNHVDRWHNIAGVPDQDVADEIAASGIDILVDLSGHTTDNRLPLFGLRPAPIQMTWLGYLCTTGLSTMDYRLCDRHTDPPGVAESWQVEEPLRLPDSQWCYQPLVALPVVGELPLLRNGFCTFGSFNQQSKLSSASLEAWADVLDAVADSRLVIVGVTLDSGVARIRRWFAERKIGSDRVHIVGRVSISEYFAYVNAVDIALDSFPYNGGTTTCDALVMGVPVATVAGHRSVARGGVSLLSTVGLGDWIAPDAALLPSLVVNQLADRERLARLRRELPARMRASPLMDAPRFASNMEALFRSARTRLLASV